MVRSYLQAYKNVRIATNNEVGAGPLVSFHTGFLSLSAWKGFLAGADRIALDNHPYIAFNSPQPTAAMSSMKQIPCQYWGKSTNASMDDFGFTNAGEWSNAVTDCGKWLNGVTSGATYEQQVGSCNKLLDYDNWTDSYKDALKDWAMASMDALQVWDIRVLVVKHNTRPELVLLDMEGRQFDCDGQGHLAALVVPARTRRRLDADGPAHGRRRMRRHGSVDGPAKHGQRADRGGPGGELGVAADDDQQRGRGDGPAVVHADRDDSDAHRADAFGERDVD